MGSHSPGPWTNLDGHIMAGDGAYRWVATVHKGYIIHETAEANARLIAAAPDLLDRLCEVEAYLGDKCDWGILDLSPECPLWLSVRHAIKKAGAVVVDEDIRR